MVALAQWIEEKEPGVVADNRVWDFSGEPPNRVRRTPVQVADGDWEITVVGYDWRRDPSLAQRGEITSFYSEYADAWVALTPDGYSTDSIYVRKALYDQRMAEIIAKWERAGMGVLVLGTAGLTAYVGIPSGAAALLLLDGVLTAAVPASAPLGTSAAYVVLQHGGGSGVVMLVGRFGIAQGATATGILADIAYNATTQAVVRIVYVSGQAWFLGTTGGSIPLGYISGADPTPLPNSPVFAGAYLGTQIGAAAAEAKKMYTEHISGPDD